MRKFMVSCMGIFLMTWGLSTDVFASDLNHSKRFKIGNILLAILGYATGSKQEVAEALKIIKKYDGIEFSKAKAKELVEKSWKEAEACITESSAKSLLREFANYVVERQS